MKVSVTAGRGQGFRSRTKTKKERVEKVCRRGLVHSQPTSQRYSAGEWKNVEVGTGRGLRMENSVTEKKQEWKT